MVRIVETIMPLERKLNAVLLNNSYKLIECQSCHHLETSQLICRANQLTWQI